MNFTVGQTIYLKVGEKGRKMEAMVIATGGGNTTIKHVARVEGGLTYPERGKLKCYRDEDLAKELA